MKVPGEVFGPDWSRYNLRCQAVLGNQSWIADASMLQGEGRYILALCLNGSREAVEYCLKLPPTTVPWGAYILGKYAQGVSHRLQAFREQARGLLELLYVSTEGKLHFHDEFGSFQDGWIISVPDDTVAGQLAGCLQNAFEQMEILEQKSWQWRDLPLVGMGSTVMEALEALAIAEGGMPIRDYNNPSLATRYVAA